MYSHCMLRYMPYRCFLYCYIHNALLAATIMYVTGLHYYTLFTLSCICVCAATDLYIDYNILHPPSYNKKLLGLFDVFCVVILMWFYDTNLWVSLISSSDLRSV